MGAKRTRVSGWGGYPAVESELVRPERVAGIAPVLGGYPHLVARGLGRSYGDASFASDGATVLTERLDRCLELDEDAGELDCEAGVRLDDLVKLLVPKGLFPSVVPGTSQVTVGGLVAADVHGKNHHQSGATSRHVREIGLVLASGERVSVSRERDPELFWATLGGMGLTGFIERVRLSLERIETAFLAVDVDRTSDLDEALAAFHGSDERYAFSVAWIDTLARGKHLGRGVLLRANWLPASALPRKRAGAPLGIPRRLGLGVPFRPPAGLLTTASVRAFNTAFYHRQPKRARGLVEDLDRYFFPLDAVHDWNRLYGPRGFLQYQLVVPEDGGREALRAILELSADAGVASFLSVLKRFGPAEAEQMLSFPEPGYTLALDLPMKGPETLSLLDRFDRVVLDHGGRVYLAKDARLSPESFRAMYPELPRFLSVKERVDPEGRFASDLARRLEIVR